jgi:hypothetical protein
MKDNNKSRINSAPITKLKFSDKILGTIENCGKSLSSRLSSKKNLDDSDDETKSKKNESVDGTKSKKNDNDDGTKSNKKKFPQIVKNIIRTTSRKILHEVQRDSIQEEKKEIFSPVNSPRNYSRRNGSRFEKVEIGNKDDMDREELAIDEKTKWDWPINIWSEENGDKFIRKSISENVVTGGSFNELVKYLTSIIDIEYTNTFLLTYKSFASPRILLKKLIERYKCDGNQENIHIIQTKCIGFLVKWIEDSFTDFNTPMISEVQEFVEYIRIDNKNVADKLEQVLVNQLIGLSQKKIIQFETQPPPSKLPKDLKKIDILSLDSQEVARQITLQDWEYFESIKPIEFLNKAWSHPILKHRAGNVLNMIHRFNKLSNWTVHSILNYSILKKRAKAYTKFVDIAYDLYEMNNFNGAISICSGLNTTAIFRLKLTKEKASSTLTSTKFETLLSLMDTKDSYKIYRDTLAKSSNSCIPHLGVFLQDLTFIEDGNADTMEHCLINFAKRRMIYKSILSIKQFQQIPYNYSTVDPIRDFITSNIESSSLLSEEDMFNISKKLEPTQKVCPSK